MNINDVAAKVAESVWNSNEMDSDTLGIGQLSNFISTVPAYQDLLALAEVGRIRVIQQETPEEDVQMFYKLLVACSAAVSALPAALKQSIIEQAKVNQ